MKRSTSSKHARLDRACERAIQTGEEHYSVTEDTIDFCVDQIQKGRSSFVFRWTKLKLHRVMAPQGVLYAMYDPTVKTISFFIDKTLGIKISKLASGSSWGKKRPTKTLLPELPPELAAKLDQSSQPPEGQVSLRLGDESEIISKLILKLKTLEEGASTEGFTAREYLMLASKMKSHIHFFEKKMQSLMSDGIAANYEKISRYDNKVSLLKDSLESLGQFKPADGTDISELDRRRRSALDGLEAIQKELDTCNPEELIEKSRQLEAIKLTLTYLIPADGQVDRRQALEDAVVRTAKVLRRIKLDPSMYDDMPKVRAKLSTLIGMYKAIYADRRAYTVDSAAQFVQEEDDEYEEQVVTVLSQVDPDEMSGSIEERVLQIQEAIAELREEADRCEVDELSGIYSSVDLLRRELRELKECLQEPTATGSNSTIASLDLRIKVADEHIKWFCDVHETDEKDLAAQLREKRKHLEALKRERGRVIRACLESEKTHEQTAPVQEQLQ